MYSCGTVHYSYAAHYGSNGVVPALVLNLQSVVFDSGSGTENSPYIIKVLEREKTKEALKEIATPTSSKVLVNGTSVEFEAYTIKGNNYFKLRDIAKVVSGTTKQFDVSWDGSKNAINLLSATSYTEVGGELIKGTGVTSIAPLSTATIYKDGVQIELEAYTINGNNFFRLRDLAKAFDIGVTWDGATNTVGIDTSIGYTE